MGWAQRTSSRDHCEKSWCEGLARQTVEKTISPFCSFVNETGDSYGIYPDGALLCNMLLPSPFLTKHGKSYRAGNAPVLSDFNKHHETLESQGQHRRRVGYKIFCIVCTNAAPWYNKVHQSCEIVAGKSSYRILIGSIANYHLIEPCIRISYTHIYCPWYSSISSFICFM